MADRYYDKREFDQVMKDYEKVGVFKSDTEKKAMQAYLDAIGKGVDDFVKETFTPEHPGETMAQASGQRPLTASEAAEKNRGISANMITHTLAAWAKGPVSGSLDEHDHTVHGNMAWAIDPSSAANNVGKVLVTPKLDGDGNHITDKDGNIVTEDVAHKAEINKPWAETIVGDAMKYAQTLHKADVEQQRLHTLAEQERQAAKNDSTLYNETQDMNRGGAPKQTIADRRQLHLNEAARWEEQAAKAHSQWISNANELINGPNGIVHRALHGSALDPDNQNLHHQIKPGEQGGHGDHKHNDHHSDASSHTKSMHDVVMNLARNDPKAALQFANYMREQLQPAATQDQQQDIGPQVG